MIFALLHYGNEDYHCAVRHFNDINEYNSIKSALIETFDKDWNIVQTDMVSMLEDGTKVVESFDKSIGSPSIGV